MKNEQLNQIIYMSTFRDMTPDLLYFILMITVGRDTNYGSSVRRELINPCQDPHYTSAAAPGLSGGSSKYMKSEN